MAFPLPHPHFTQKSKAVASSVNHIFSHCISHSFSLSLSPKSQSFLARFFAAANRQRQSRSSFPSPLPHSTLPPSPPYSFLLCFLSINHSLRSPYPFQPHNTVLRLLGSSISICTFNRLPLVTPVSSENYGVPTLEQLTFRIDDDTYHSTRYIRTHHCRPRHPHTLEQLT